MNNRLELYLIRHTEPLIEKGTCYGQLDCLVTDEYEQSLAKINGYFSDKEISAIYSSPLIRCAKLATDLADSQQLAKVTYIEELKEIHFGDWEGKKWADIPRIKIDEWNNNRLTFQFPNGESPIKFHERILQCLSELVSHSESIKASGKIIIIAHAGVIRSILCHYLHIPFYHSTTLKVDYASLSKVVIQQDMVTCHFVNRLLS